MENKEDELIKRIEDLTKDLKKESEKLMEIQKQKEREYKWFDFVLLHEQDGYLYSYKMKMRTDIDSMDAVLGNDFLKSEILDALNHLCYGWNGAMSCIPIDGCIFVTMGLDIFLDTLEEFENHLNTDFVVTCLADGRVSVCFEGDLK